MSCGIYKITNLINNHSYIGQSTNIEQRWSKEKYRAYNNNSKSYNSILSQAFRKYGLDNFSFEILEECEIALLDEREKYYIQYYNTYLAGYNATTGGQGSSNNSLKISKKELLEIYDLLQNSTIPQNDIAQQYKVGADVISTINQGKSRRLPGYKYPLRDNSSKKNHCQLCGKNISHNAKLCAYCLKISQRKIDRPSREELKQMIRHTPFTSIGKQFGVSDNTIRKWCDSYGLPRKKVDIQSYSDDEWLNI